MKWKIWVGTILNFFLLGPGYLFFTKKKVLGVFLTIGAVLATWVEQVPLSKMEDKTPFAVMFAAFLCLALGCAIDGYQEIKKGLAGS
ncbi:MAG: hypothetical protein HYZ28_02640 [Myxococcales bacterium]|nr:hypothetical protein [Myxococcales bacterium]